MDYTYKTESITAAEAEVIEKMSIAMGWTKDEAVIFYLLSKYEGLSLGSANAKLRWSDLNLSGREFQQRLSRFERLLKDSQGDVKTFEGIFETHSAMVLDILRSLVKPEFFGDEVMRAIKWQNYLDALININLSSFNGIDNYETRTNFFWHQAVGKDNDVILNRGCGDYIFGRWKHFHPLFNRVASKLAINLRLVIGGQGDSLYACFIDNVTNKPLSLKEVEDVRAISQQPWTEQEIAYFILKIAEIGCQKDVFFFSDEGIISSLFPNYWHLFEKFSPEEYAQFAKMNPLRAFYWEVDLEGDFAPYLDDTDVESLSVTIEGSQLFGWIATPLFKYLDTLNSIQFLAKFSPCQDDIDKKCSLEQMAKVVDLLDIVLEPLIKYQLEEYGGTTITVSFKCHDRSNTFISNRKKNEKPIKVGKTILREME